MAKRETTSSSRRVIERYIGIDYSGAKAPPSKLSGLQVHEGTPEALPVKALMFADASGRGRGDVAFTSSDPQAEGGARTRRSIVLALPSDNQRVFA